MSNSLSRYYKILGFRGLVCAIKAKVTNSVILYDFKNEECQHSIHLRIPSSDAPTYRQVFIKREYDVSVKQDPKVILDAGANIGLASIYFANRFPDAKIIALEPEESNFSLLKKNVLPYKNIIPIHAALWNKNEEISLVDPGLGNWGFMTEN
jgi:tRNA G46 methylase TrmB